jgi:hypothetical protein
VFSIHHLAVFFYEEGCICVMGQLPAGSPPIHWRKAMMIHKCMVILTKFYVYSKNIKHCFSETKESFFRKKDKDLFTENKQNHQICKVTYIVE